MPRIIQPSTWPRPRGYANGVAARGEVLAIAGQIGWNTHEQLVSPEFGPQFGQALANVVAVVEAAGGGPTDIVSLTVFVTDKREYTAALPEVGSSWRRTLGKHFPAMALVQVSDLLEAGAKVEIQGLAVLSGEASPGEGTQA